MTYGLALAWAAILVGCWLGWQLLRQNGRLLLRLEELEKRLDALEFGEDEQPTGLPVGSEAPAFELTDLAGEARSLAQFQGQTLLLIFFNPACGFCREFVPRLQEKAEDEKHRAEIESVLIVSTGDAKANRDLFAENSFCLPVLLQKEAEVASAYHANGTPSGYLITPDGKIASALAMGSDALLDLAKQKPEARNQKSAIDQSPDSSAAIGNGDDRAGRFSNRSLARSKIKRDGLKAGTPAPHFRLPRLDGRGDLSLEEFRGRRVLLVFSSPNCGPCNTLAPELEKFYRQNRAGARSPSHGGDGRSEGETSRPLQVVMISKGDPKENRAKVKQHGLTFPVVLQQQWEISRRYAMFATPVAYLINETGVIESDAAVGEAAILRLTLPNSLLVAG
jgi:peroxiredoxin